MTKDVRQFMDVFVYYCVFEWSGPVIGYVIASTVINTIQFNCDTFPRCTLCYKPYKTRSEVNHSESHILHIWRKSVRIRVGIDLQ